MDSGTLQAERRMVHPVYTCACCFTLLISVFYSSRSLISRQVLSKTALKVLASLSLIPLQNSNVHLL